MQAFPRVSCENKLFTLLSEFEVILTVHRSYYVEIKCQLHATDDIYKICNKYHLLHLVDILIPHNHTTCSTHFHHIQNMCGSGNIHSAELLRAAGIIARIQSP